MRTVRVNPRPKALASAVIVAGLISAVPALADDYAYEGNGDGGFGVVDLTTGVFTSCGTSSLTLSGFGVAKGKLYGGVFQSQSFNTIDTATGALTLVGTSNVTFWDTGSTTKAVYAVGTDGNLYKMNTGTGHGTLIGPTGITITLSSWYGLSTNAKALYFTVDSNLYSINLKTGHATLIGSTGQSFGAEVFEGDRLYAGARTPLTIQSLDTTTGATTFVSDLTGPSNSPWGLAPIKAKSIPQGKICTPHKL